MLLPASKLIFEGRNSLIYHRLGDGDSEPVIIKILKAPHPTPQQIAQFNNEYVFTHNLSSTGVRKAYKCTQINGKPALLLEYFNGITLRQAFETYKYDLKTFLRIAIEITKALSSIHKSGIIHKDINSKNILINEKDLTIKIIDFGISTKVDMLMGKMTRAENLEGTLAYISPEQTGRMNRVVDHRSDLYALGVTFYELLARKMPFTSTVPIDLVHAHIATAPVSPQEHNKSIPTIIAKIVLKLLSKNAEERYQSAEGLMCDLQRCLTTLTTTNTLAQVDFLLAQRDFSGRLVIPQRLYGRETAISILEDRFQKLCLDGKSGLFAVEGDAGTGKSALVGELYKTITRKSAYFFTGKFKQLQKNTPYYALLQALEKLIDSWLSLPKDALEKWRVKIKQALGNSAKALTDVLPSLSLIIGEPDTLTTLGLVEAQNRFNYVLKQFVKCVATAAHPLVLFIDDCQWADIASLQVFKTLLNDSSIQYLLLITAYRPNEVTANHSFTLLLEELLHVEKVNVITIENLTYPQVLQLLLETLQISGTDTNDLATLLHQKTNGNPFFVRAFLQSLYAEQLLWFDTKEWQWQWQLIQIQQRNITDNVVDLMASQILQLPPASQRVLQLAACIGNSFNLRTLATVYESSEQETAQCLQIAVEKGILIPTGDNYMISDVVAWLDVPISYKITYKFAHDRIQQALYELIPVLEKAVWHNQIAHLLQANLPKNIDITTTKAQVNEQLFETVNHWNIGKAIVQDSSEKQQFLHLNLQAATLAKKATAYSTANTYYVIAWGLLKELAQEKKINAWQYAYQKSLELHNQMAEIAYLSGDFNEMERLTQTVNDRAVNLLDKVQSHRIKLEAYASKAQFKKAVEVGCNMLEELGHTFPKVVKKHHVLLALLHTKWQFLGKSLAKVALLDTMKDAKQKASLQMMGSLLSAAYFSNKLLFPLLVLKMNRLSLQYGNLPESASAYATHGLVLCSALKQYDLGYKLAKLGITVAKKLQSQQYLAIAKTTSDYFIAHFQEPIKKILPNFVDNYQICVETGNQEYAALSLLAYSIYSLFSGLPLEIANERMEKATMFMHNADQKTSYVYTKIYQQCVHNFLGFSANANVLKGKAYDIDVMLPIHEEENNTNALLTVHCLSLWLQYAMGNYKQALAQSEKASVYAAEHTSSPLLCTLYFYQALTAINLFDTFNVVERRSWGQKIKANYKVIKKWAKQAPFNYLHKKYLLEAQINYMKGKYNIAKTTLDKAIATAREYGFIHEEALGFELAGKMAFEQKTEHLAQWYFQNAYGLYNRWGSQAKLRQLKQSYAPYLVNSNALGKNAALETWTVSGGSSGSGNNSNLLDLATVVKASQAISGEIMLDKLLISLMETVFEGASAQRGFFIVTNENKFTIQAQGSNKGNIQVLQNIPLKNTLLLDESIVNYVIRAQKKVVLHDANKDKRFANSTYIRQNQVKSVLCLPIKNKNTLVGILYLENNLTVGVFNPTRMELIEVLSGQMAISLENSLLYDSLEQRVRDRTAELAAEKEKTDALLLNILPAEIAQELKESETPPPAQKYEMVSILFADLKDFTLHAERISSTSLIKELEYCFSAFDDIITRHRLEKIKTIGDAYMCAGGIPVANETNAVDAVQAAIEMQHFMKKWAEQKSLAGEPAWRLRIGINTGEVIAGVIGKRKFAYDVWGDSVNLAARMEQAGEAGKVNISPNTYDLVKKRFKCQHRGKHVAKNYGLVDMYFVSELSN